MTRATRSSAKLEPSLRAADALASTEARSAACLSTDDVLLLVLGQLPDAPRAEALEHVDLCLDCQLLLAGAAQALRDTGDMPSPAPGGVFTVGERVANRYRVERFIARGGMGEVYAVHDTVLDEAVALKTVRGASPSDEKAIRRLKSEAQLSRRIGHPHTCRIYEFGEYELARGGVIYFFTMALVEGETLGVKLRRDGPMSPDLARVVARQVLGGLSEAHTLGVLHRDLKSENIMLRSAPGLGLPVDAVIMDFGLALRLDSDERLTSDSHALVGSAAYMAPEQVEGERLTPAADIYAFGVILFEMLTGQLPFRGKTLAATALSRLRQAAPAPSSINAALGPAWDGIVKRCLERSPAQRFANAREVLAALDGWEVTQESGGRLPRRGRRAAVALAAAAVVAAGLFGARSLLTRAPAPVVSAPVSAPVVLSEAAALPALIHPQPEPPAAIQRPQPPAPASNVQPERAAPPHVKPARSAARQTPPSAPHAVAESQRGAAAQPSADGLVQPAVVQPAVGQPIVEPPEAPVGPLPIDTEFPR